ncbi:PD40 domain-containing protein, partial [Candidatus Bipolaricaulota bacterium]|nr:PD40 domain-containing protein [Candidatus Bipolaricaulota bacterium]
NQIQPSWSSDGSTIAYASNATQTPSSTTWELFTMTAAGATQTKLTAQAPSWAIAPAYSPVNDDILFVSNKTATGESSIWLWDDEEDEAAELYVGPGNDGDASPSLGVFSPPLLLPAEAGISKPAWSLDGTEIAFSTERTDGGIIDIYVIDVSGAVPGTPVSLETYVTTHASYTGSITAATITSAEDEFSPYWLEDGSGMVFVKEIAGAYHVYKVSFITGLVTKLTATGANISPASNR